MTNFKSLTIWTIVLSFFILVGAGHGLICVGLLDVFWIVATLTGRHISQDFASFSLTGSYEQSLGAAALLSFLGQVILLISFTIKEPGKIRIKLLGLSLLWVGYYYLIHNCLKDSASQLSLFSGIPFLISSGLLTYRMIKEKLSSIRSQSVIEKRL